VEHTCSRPLPRVR